MDMIGDLGDAKKLQPILDQVVQTAATALVQQVIPALQTALEGALDGLTITVVVSRKKPSAG